ncbi:hypothetical protein PoB_003240200 [Plakobranchus ocellatus]|uniref:Uncharacterized protein n=1 Tax=Plakobranchus ocellatus TaxID=259542 RepID=A0AAV4AFT3_9GAST|nr:hypothetical protein PoB_003240200 [Plakobranchus ocellatus]
MGIGCSLQDKTEDTPVLTKVRVRQDCNKGDKPAVLTSKSSMTSARDDDSKLKAEGPRKWVQPLPTPLPKGPQLITPDVSSFTVTDSSGDGCLGARDRREPGGGGGRGDIGGGTALLGVGTLQSGHSSVASDALSATGFSTHSSNSVSISSSLSTNTALTPSGLHKWKMPPRLESMSSSLQKLLLGHPESLLDLVSRPSVINLKIVAPGEDYMKERLFLLSDVIVPLRLLCAEKGFALDVQDDLWARSTLTQYACHMLALQEAEVDNEEQGLGGYIENNIDVVLVRKTNRSYDKTYMTPFLRHYTE